MTTSAATLSRLIAFRAEEIFEDAGGDFISVTELEDWILSQRSDDSKSAEQILGELLEIIK